jgi:protein-disulfide isomerase
MTKTNDLIILNPNGTIEIIEFFDYNCGHCKRQSLVIDKLLKERKDVRVILRPIPVLGEESLYAAQIGYAVLMMEPEKFIKYYNEIMHSSGGEGIYNAINACSIDINKLKDTLSSKKGEIDSIMEFNIDSANSLGINGTPAFVINGKMTMGEIDFDTLKKKIG